MVLSKHEVFTYGPAALHYRFRESEQPEVDYKFIGIFQE